MEDMGYTPAEIARMEVDRAADAINATPVDTNPPASLDAARAQRDQRPVIGRSASDANAA
jgi:hypothetical protein